MRFDRLFTKLFCSPLCLEAGVRAGFERVLLAFMAGTPAELPKLVEEQPRFWGKKTDPTRSDRYMDDLLEVDGDQAIIHIDGAIDRNLSAWDRLCFDATDLNDVNRALARVGTDNSINKVLLAINSPGGTVNGVPETAGKIAQLSRNKDVISFINGMGCSSAYWLACAADQVFATESSMSGSVGVYMALLDQSRWLEEEGMKIETIKEGKLKAAGVSWKPLTDDERAHFQQTVSQIGEMFRQAVNAKRPDVERATMEGQAFFGKAALEAGLIDALKPDMASALAEFP